MVHSVCLYSSIVFPWIIWENIDSFREEFGVWRKNQEKCTYIENFQRNFPEEHQIWFKYDFLLKVVCCRVLARISKLNPATIPKRPVQPIMGIGIHAANGDFCEPGSGILQPGSPRKKEYNTMEVPMTAANERIHTFGNNRKIFSKLYSTNLLKIKYLYCST